MTDPRNRAAAAADLSVPRIAPHPRMRQRRVEVKRDEGRRRLRILLAFVAVGGVAAGAFGITRSPLLDVDHVHVRGAGSTTPDDVVRASGLERHPPMVDVDPAAVARAVERLPWVQHAQVDRHFPNTIEVTLLERTPVAAVPAAGEQWALVDSTGRVLSHAPQAPAELTRVEASDPAGAPGSTITTSAKAALTVVEGLPGVLVGRVPAVVVTSAGALELRLDGKVPVHFGPPRQVEDKLVALATLVQKADLRWVRAIDVRVPTAPVLTRA